jgi:hypothetical protein
MANREAVFRCHEEGVRVTENHADGTWSYTKEYYRLLLNPKKDLDNNDNNRVEEVVQD